MKWSLLNVLQVAIMAMWFFAMYAIQTDGNFSSFKPKALLIAIGSSVFPLILIWIVSKKKS